MPPPTWRTAAEGCAGARVVRAAAVALLAACSAETATIQPLAWARVDGSTSGVAGSVLAPGAAGAFDEAGVFTVSAFQEGGVTYLYYGGADGSGLATCPGINLARWRVGLATSTDGVTFTRVPGDGPGGALLDVGAPGAFDSWLTYRPFVLHDGATWRMWYNGSTKPFRDCRLPAGPDQLADDRRIGYAESSDGVHWTRRYDGDGPGGSVLPLGAPGEIDARQVGYVWVLKDGAGYKLYYSANDVTNTWRVALAVSTDARHWTKVRGKNADGSVLDLGPGGAFDVACAYQPSVVKDASGLYRMWYRGCQAAAPVVGGPSQGAIGYAESNDGITWVKVNGGGPAGEALAKGPAGRFDDAGLTTPSVLRSEGGWSMYYAGFNASGLFQAGLARAAAR